MKLKDQFEVVVISCEHCGGTGRWETHKGLENCPRCRGLGEVEVIEKKETGSEYPSK